MGDFLEQMALVGSILSLPREHILLPGTWSALAIEARSAWLNRLFPTIYLPVDTLNTDAERPRHTSGKTNQPQLRIYRLKRP